MPPNYFDHGPNRCMNQALSIVLFSYLHPSVTSFQQRQVPFQDGTSAKQRQRTSRRGAGESYRSYERKRPEQAGT